MTTYLKPKEYYESIYDSATVSGARRDIELFTKLYDKWFELMPDEEPTSFRSAFHLNGLYMQIVGNHLLARYDERDGYIQQMMSRDEAKDSRIAAARLMREPVCIHCKKIGLRIHDKDLHRRDGGEDVLFMLQCTHCEKMSAYWEDGGRWEVPPTPCPKCRAAMDKTDSRKGDVITLIYSCPACHHTYKDTLDLHIEEKKPDPNFEEDRYRFCLHDPKVLEEHRNAKMRYDGLIKLGEEFKEREKNKDAYEAAAKLRNLKIAELKDLLSPILEQEGYTEFSLEKPAMGRFVVVPFSCLDGKPSRNDYESRKNLKKKISDTLADTNWRLMSEGVSYRLGYLAGRLRAYETEEDLATLLKPGIIKYQLNIPSFIWLN